MKKTETTVTMVLDGKASTMTLGEFDEKLTKAMDKNKEKHFTGLPGKSAEDQAFDKLKEMTKSRQILSVKTDGDTFSVKYREMDRDRVFAFTDRPAGITKLIECLQKYKPIICGLMQEKLDVAPNEVTVTYDKYGLKGVSVGCVAACKDGEAAIKIRPNFAAVLAVPTVEVFEWANKAIDRIIMNESAIRKEDPALPFEDQD